MKKLTVLTLVIIMLAMSAVPALAAGGPPASRGTASGNCTGNQLGIGAGNQNSYGAGNQVGFSASTQVSFGTRTPYALSGTISAIDPAAKTVTVTVICGNRLTNPFIGQEVTLLTSDSTRFLRRNVDGTVTPITFDDPVFGQNVSSHGTLVNNVWIATRVTSGALLTCQP